MARLPGALLLAAVFWRAACEPSDSCEADPATGSTLLQLGASTVLAPAVEQLRKEPSFAVFTRAIAQEIPYLRSFVRHYTRLGAGHIYLLSNRKEDLSKVENYLRDHPVPGATYTFLYRKGGADDILARKGLLQAIREDYVVTVDLDEYWVLPEGMESFQDLAAQRPADIWYANWSIVPNDGLQGAPQPPYHGFLDSHTKWIARRNIIETFFGIHHCHYLPGVKRILNNTGVLVHFYARSFVDVVTKGLSQFFRDGTVYEKFNDSSGAWHGSEGFDLTTKLLLRGDLPEKLKVLALLSRHPRTHVLRSDHALLEIDADAETALLEGLTRKLVVSSKEWVEHVRERYLLFQACMNDHLFSNPTWLLLGPMDAAEWLETLPCLVRDAPDSSAWLQTLPPDAA